MLSSLESVLANSRVFDLSQPMKQGMPRFRAHVPFSFTINIRHTDFTFPNGAGVSNDVILGCTHSGTHIDAIGHFSSHGCLYGGVDVREAVTGQGGLLKHGIEQTPPILQRGVLFDVAAFKNKDVLDAGYAITADDLERTAKVEGVELRKGDVALIRTGFARHWENASKYVASSPGPDLSGSQWLLRNGASLTGADTMTYEVDTGAGGGTVHAFQLAEQGVQIIENLDLEALAKERIYSFMFFALPLRIVGATASPIRPIAICS